jgi:hypothetical protein
MGKRHRPEEIIGKLREAEIAQGGTTADGCRIAAAEQTYYRLRKEYSGLKTDQARRMSTGLRQFSVGFRVWCTERIRPDLTSRTASGTPGHRAERYRCCRGANCACRSPVRPSDSEIGPARGAVYIKRASCVIDDSGATNNLRRSDVPPPGRSCASSWVPLIETQLLAVSGSIPSASGSSVRCLPDKCRKFGRRRRSCAVTVY